MILTPSQKLVLAVRLEVLNPQMVVLMMAETPKAVQQSLRLVYDRPELILGGQPREQIELRLIRRDFPSVIEHFSDDRLTDVLTALPRVNQRLIQEQEIMSEIHGTPEVKTIEYLLQFMKADGSIANITAENVQQVIDSHNLYQALVDRIDLKRQIHSAAEEGKFKQVGQALLLTRRIVESDMASLDLDYRSMHDDPEKDYRGRLAQILLEGKIIGALMALGRDKEMIGRHQAQAHAMIEQVAVNHPARYPDLRERLNIQDFFKWGSWSESPQDAYRPISKRSDTPWTA